MGSKVEVRGLAVGDEKIYRFEKPVRDVIQSSNLPVRITMTEEGEDRSDLVDKLRKVFVSEDAITGTFLITLGSRLHCANLRLTRCAPRTQSQNRSEIDPQAPE